MQEPREEILRFPPESGCFGCSAQNPAGLQLVFKRSGDEIHCDYVIPDRFHGAPGIAHGGIVATITDEVSCAAVFFLRNRHVVTGELAVRYEKPCPVETPLHFRARILSDSNEHGRFAVVEAQVERDGVLLARSTGKFFYVERGTSAP
jgi:acyl-coenzyme A thioesterase PaaI-like protein